MNCSKIFKGKIKVLTNKKKFKTINFEFDLGEFHIDELVMSNFSDLEFSDMEKRELTTNHRRIIKQFQVLSPKEMRKFAVELARVIKKADGDRIDVEAKDAGSFICLCSILSGKLPKDKNIYFHLNSTPLNLFPRTLVKDKNAALSYSVNFCNNSECWLRPFKSLTKVPKFMSFNGYSDHSYEEDSILLG